MCASRPPQILQAARGTVYGAPGAVSAGRVPILNVNISQLFGVLFDIDRSNRRIGNHGNNSVPVNRLAQQSGQPNFRAPAWQSVGRSAWRFGSGRGTHESQGAAAAAVVK